MNDNKMFEPRTVIALIVAFSGIFGWQYFLAKKYPKQGQQISTDSSANKSQANETQQGRAGTDSSGTVMNSGAAGHADPSKNGSHRGADVSDSSPTGNHGDLLQKALSPRAEESFVSVKTSNFNLVVSSFGMGLKQVELLKFTDREKQLVKLGDDSGLGLFAAKLVGKENPLNFKLEKVNELEVQGIYHEGDLEITRHYKFDPETYSLSSDFTVSHGDRAIEKGLEFLLADRIVKSTSSHFLFPSYDHQDFVVKQSGKVETVNYSMVKEDYIKSYSNASLVSIGSQYFTAAILDKSDLIPELFLETRLKEARSVGGLKYVPVKPEDHLKLSQLMYFGPKKVELLKAVDAELVETLNYGVFSMIAHPILSLMKMLFQFSGNWGIAIILLTLIVRLIVLPFNLFSARSMKAMQKIQPLLKATREKYKDDPMAMNRETMAIMKEHKANPLSGCLPMLLQIPIFFALYRVIASSVEIYQQPFFGWIQDLSLHDKFFVLPFLMGVVMFVQQKTTPSTMDPAQAKIMLFMPLIFTGLMIYLPSGLTLYMFVSALFGFLQQYYVMRQKTA